MTRMTRNTRKTGYPIYPKQLRFEHIISGNPQDGYTIWLKIIYPHTARGGDPKGEIK